MQIVKKGVDSLHEKNVVVPYESLWEEDFLVEKEAIQMLIPKGSYDLSY